MMNHTMIAIALMTVMAFITSIISVTGQSRLGYSSAPLYSLTFDAAPAPSQLASTSFNNGGFDWVASSAGRQGVAFLNRQGKNYVDMANYTDNYGRTMPQFGGEVSFEVWIMQRDASLWQRALTFAIGSQTANPSSEIIELITAVNGGSQYRYAVRYGAAVVASPFNTPVGTARYGEWVHLVATTSIANASDLAAFGAGFSTIYANAVNLTQGASYVPRNISRNVNWLGRSAYPADVREHCFIDSFNFYNYPLSAEAVYAHLQVSRVPIYELTFSVNPATLTGATSPTYSWMAADGPRNLGLVRFDGSSSQSINLIASTGASGVGTSFPSTIGGPSVGSPVNPGSSFEVIVKFYGLTNGASIFDLTSGSSRLRLSLNSNNNIVFSAGSVTVTSSSVAATGIFYHIAAVITPTSGGQGTYTLYINGVSVGTATGATLSTATSYTSAFLGQSTDTTPVYLNAAIDAFRVYDIALSSSEVSGLYSTIVSPPSGFNPAEPPVYDVTSPSGPMVSYTFSQPPPSFGSVGLSNWSYLAQDDEHLGVAVFDGQLNALDLNNYADDYGRQIPTFFGGAVSFEAWIQILDNSNQAMIWSFSGVAGLIDNNIHLINTNTAVTGEISSLSFQVYGDASYSKTSSIYCYGCTNGQWKHVIVTISQPNITDTTSATSGLVSMYIDGALVASGNCYLPQYYYRPNLWLAKSPWPSDEAFFGNIDSFHFYDYGLSAEAVSAHFALDLPPEYEFTFSADPRITAGPSTIASYSWLANDTTGIHEGLLVLAGTNYVNLSATSGANFIGYQALAPIGNNRNTPGVAANLANGFAVDVVFYATSVTAGSTIFDIASVNGANAITLAFTATSLTFVAGGTTLDCGAVAANQWQHVLVSITPDTVGFAGQCYVNGVRRTTVNNFPAISVVARNSALLGKSNTAANSNFNGQIDAFRLYNRGITSDIEQSLYQAYINRNAIAGAAPYQSGPMVSYTFDKPPQAFTEPTTEATYNYYSWQLNSALAPSINHTGVAVFSGAGQSNALRQYVDLNFDQDAYGRTMPQLYGGALSFETWVSFANYTSYMRVFDVGDNSNNAFNNGNGAGQWNMVLGNDDSNPPGIYMINYYAQGAADEFWVGNGWGPTNEWRHVIAVFQKTSDFTAQLLIYVNGVLMRTQFTRPPPVEMRRLSWLGRSNWNDNAFNGSIDSFYFYNYALSQQQVSLHYNIPNPPQFDATFDTNPALVLGTTNPNYGWSATDNTDPTRTGIVTFNGSNQFVDIAAGAGVNSIGQIFPSITSTSVGIGQDGWSMEVCFKYSSLTSATSSKVFDFGNGGGVDSIALGNSGTGLYFIVNNGITDDTSTIPLFTATANTWYHMIIISTPVGNTSVSLYTVYLNGVQQTQVSGIRAVSMTRRSAFIGKSNTASDSLFSGSIDSLRYYTYSLSSPTVRYLASLANVAPIVVAPIVASSSSTGVNNLTPSSSSSSSAAASPSSSSAVVGQSGSSSSTSSSAAPNAITSATSPASSSLAPSPSASAASSAIFVTSSSSNQILPGGGDSSSSSSLSSGAIAGIVIGCVIGGLLLCVLCFCCLSGRVIGKRDKFEQASGDKFDRSNVNESEVEMEEQAEHQQQVADDETV